MIVPQLRSHPQPSTRGRGSRSGLPPSIIKQIRIANFRQNELLPLPLCLHFAQFGLENFSVIILRQRVDEYIFLRTLEASNCVDAKSVELAGRRVADDVCNDDLAPFAVGPSDDG